MRKWQLLNNNESGISQGQFTILSDLQICKYGKGLGLMSSQGSAGEYAAPAGGLLSGKGSNVLSYFQHVPELNHVTATQFGLCFTMLVADFARVCTAPCGY